MAQCLSLHMRIMPLLQKYLSCPVYFTIGHISLGEDNSFFKQSESSLKNMLIEGAPGPSISLHAWLTLPIMEILDFSFPTTYAVKNKLDQGVGSVIATHPSDLSGDMMYHPMLVGYEFLQKIGAMNMYVSIKI